MSKSFLLSNLPPFSKDPSPLFSSSKLPSRHLSQSCPIKHEENSSLSSFFLSLSGTGKERFPLPISSAESRRDSPQSSSCRRYAAHTSTVHRGEHDAWTQLKFCFFLSVQLVKFKKDNLRVGFGSATLALEQAIEKTTANIKWVTENKAEVLQWLTEEAT